MTYRVPYKLTGDGATNKARIVYANEPGAVQWVEFTARTHKEAREALQELILNGDDRPVMGRYDVRLYAIQEPTP